MSPAPVTAKDLGLSLGTATCLQQHKSGKSEQGHWWGLVLCPISSWQQMAKLMPLLGLNKGISVTVLKELN